MALRRAEQTCCPLSPVDVLQLQVALGNRAVSRLLSRRAAAHGSTSQGRGRSLPRALQSGVERLAGVSLEDVTVHYDSSRPIEVGAVAYAEGSDIHLAAGQERELPHEAWHVAQQKLGQVRATTRLNGRAINDDPRLERQADVMGARALAAGNREAGRRPNARPRAESAGSHPIQRKIGFEYEIDCLRTRTTDGWYLNPMRTWRQHNAGDRIHECDRYDVTADIAEGYSRVEFVTDAFDERDAQELRELQRVIRDMRRDIARMVRQSLANRQGYLAGVPYLGGERGWFPGDGWVGANKLFPGGRWWHQIKYEPTRGGAFDGQLQMTGGLDMVALARLMTGETLGNAREWGVIDDKLPTQDARQYVRPYAKYREESSDLYRNALAAVRRHGVCGGTEEAEPTFASVLAVMVQAPAAYRNQDVDFGQMIAKTDYAKILALAARETGIVPRSDDFLAALLQAVSATVGYQVNEGDPVFRAAERGDPLNLGRVSFRQWVDALLPDARRARDLMTRRHYPGLEHERVAMRTFGPYGERTDPGDRAIFEFRSLQKNAPSELPELVTLLSNLMNALHQ